MRVAVASRNPVKLHSVRDAFALQFPGSTIDCVTADVTSGVSDQPTTDDETRRGARNRATAAAACEPDARFSVGLEGGIEVIGNQLMAFAWMSVLGPGDRYGEARSVTLPLPHAVRRLIDQGLELGEANDRVFATENSKQRGGAYGLLTEGRYTRQGVYTQTLLIALLPFVNALYELPATDST